MKESLVRVLLLTVFLGTAALWAGTVTRAEALGVATDRLPSFFAGPWRPAGEFTLHDLDGDTVAYAFIFAGLTDPAGTTAPAETPAAFVAKQKARLATAGKAMHGDVRELYGADRFASIFISADDTEPPVLRCFRGLPPQVVKESEALALAAKGKGTGTWRVRQFLMLGLFDEAYALDRGGYPADATLVVDLRTGAVVTHAEAQQRAQGRKHAAPDPERARQCQEAWRTYRESGAALARPKVMRADAVRTPKSLPRDEPATQPLLPDPQGN